MNSKALISKGFFPRELPPPFTTKYFANFYEKNSKTLPKPEKTSRGIKYSCPRVGITRKLVVVTNPAHQAPLFDFISTKWTEIKKHYNQSTLSCSKPHYLGQRAANLPSFKTYLQECFTHSYYHRIQLKTDISKYFPSIYTHSIPWAIHTKEKAKKDHSDKLWGNVLDTLVRNTQYGQTVGIPIGPDSSYIISELIGSSIDTHLQDKFPNLVGFRYVDDMYYFFPNQTEAEIFMKEIRHIFKEYELQLNTEKTGIEELPLGIDDEWVISLRKFDIGEGSMQQKNDLISYFSLAFHYAKLHPQKAVLSYAIRRIKDERIVKFNFDLYESLLLKTVQTETSTLPDVLGILLAYKSWVGKDKLKKAISTLIQYSAPRALDFETSWALWYSISFGIKLDKKTTLLLNEVTDPISILLILDSLDQELLSAPHLDLDNWKRLINEESLWDENWILAYEISIKKWLHKKFAYIDSPKKSKYFSELKKNNISFYDNKLQVKISNNFTIEPNNVVKEKLKATKNRIIASLEYDY